MSKEHHFYISTSKLSVDGTKMYAVDLYSFNIYEVDLDIGMIQVVGCITNEKESINTIFEIHICNEVLIMIPRNGKNMHIFNLQSKEDLIVDLREKSSLENIYNCFSVCEKNQIYMVNRDNATVYRYDYLEDFFQKMTQLENSEKLQLTSSYVERDTIYMPSLSKHSVITYSIVNRTLFRISLPDELCNVIKVYIFDEVMIVYNNDNHCIYVLNQQGEIIKRYSTTFIKSHIDPFIYKDGEQLYVFGNSGGEMCKIDLTRDTVEKRIINELEDMHIDYLEKKNGYIYCMLMTETYERRLDYFIKIDVNSMQIMIQKLRFMNTNMENSVENENEKNVVKYLNDKKLFCENCVINLGKFIKFGVCR